jgi:hypothetical protein
LPSVRQGEGNSGGEGGRRAEPHFLGDSGFHVEVNAGDGGQVNTEPAQGPRHPEGVTGPAGEFFLIEFGEWYFCQFAGVRARHTDPAVLADTERDNNPSVDGDGKTVAFGVVGVVAEEAKSPGGRPQAVSGVAEDSLKPFSGFISDIGHWVSFTPPLIVPYF